MFTFVPTRCQWGENGRRGSLDLKLLLHVLVHQFDITAQLLTFEQGTLIFLL